MIAAMAATAASAGAARSQSAHGRENAAPNASLPEHGGRPLSLPAAMKRFLGYRYGAFIHWGPATVSAKEISWSRQVKTPYEQYDTLYKRFNPTEFNAESWVRSLKDGGFHYLIYVAKHHEGFAMWDTKTTDHNIMHSPFGRDVVKEISQACKKLHLPLCLYYSIADFYNPDCVGAVDSFGGNYGPPGGSLPAGQTPDFDRYVKYMKAQLKELTENYGPIVGWWFDGGWQQQWTYERGVDLYDYVRKLQPDVLMDHRVGGAYNGKVYLPTWFPVEAGRVGDYAVLEVDMPRFNRDIPWEYTTPANGRSYSWTPGPYVDPREWMENLVKSACGDGNYVLGVSAPPTGRFEPELIDRMNGANAWLKKYGESIYETRGGVYKRNTVYGSTCKGSKIYLHIFDAKATKLVLPPLPKKIVHSSMLNGGEVKVTQSDQAITVEVNAYDFQTPTTIVVLELAGSAEDISPIGETPVNRNVPVRSSNEDPATDRLASDGDMSTFWRPDGKTQPAWIEYDLGAEKSMARAILLEGAYEGESANIHHVQIEAKIGDDWKVISDTYAWGGKSESTEFDVWPISVSHPEIRFEPIKAQHVRLKLLRTTGTPVIHEFELYER